MLIHQSLLLSLLLFSLIKCEFKIFVINLKSRKDKLIQITKQLKEKGIEYEVFEGVDGKLLKRYLEEFKYDEPDEKKGEEFKLIRSVMKNQEIKLNWNNLLNDMKKKSMGFGHVGCWLSHLILLLELKRRSEDLGPVLILEDDSIISETLVGNFEQAQKSLPTDWGIYYAGHCSGSDVCVDEIYDDYCGCGGKIKVFCLQAYFVNTSAKGTIGEILKVINGRQPVIVDFAVHNAQISQFAAFPIQAFQNKSLGSDVNDVYVKGI